MLLLAGLVLVACGGGGQPDPGPQGEAPVILGLEDYVLLEVGDEFDPRAGVTAQDADGNDLTEDLVVEGEVNTAVAGFNVLIYKVTDANNLTTEATVYVVVGDAPVFGTLKDGELTTILNPIGVIVGTEFDPADDVVARQRAGGADLTAAITIEGELNLAVVGTYSVVYSVTNAFGITAEYERTVIVRPIPAPAILGANNVVVPVGAQFDPLEDVEVLDELDGDLTDELVVTGTVNVDEEGVYELTYTVENSNNLTTVVVRTVRVADGVVYAQGARNYRFADTELRHTFFAAAEKYLLETGAGGIPVFSNGGFNLFSERVSLPVEDYLPVIGFGTSFGSLTEDDSTVDFVDTGAKGEAGKYTYRSTLTTNPATLLQWLSDDSNSSDAIAPTQDALYAFVINDDQSGYDLVPSMAAADPEPVNAETQGAYQVSNVWEVEVRAGLKWAFNSQTDTTGLATDITAEDFVNTYKHALDNGWFRAISGGGDFVTSSSQIKGAKAYRDAAAADRDWDDVGLEVVDGNKIRFTFVNAQSEWDVKYWLSSNSITPVHLGLLAREGASYGTTPAKTAYTGKFILETWEADKVLRYVKNPDHHTIDGPYETNFTGYNFAIIEEAQNRFQEFLAGRLDAAGVPTENYDEVASNPGLKRVPGTTTFRLMVNGLGTATNQRAQFPNSTYVPEPLLANLNFKKAMYFAIDRQHLAEEVLKTSQTQMYHFTEAYMVDPQSGVPFRLAPEAGLVDPELSPDTNGYSEDAAKDYYKDALDELIAQGHYVAGTAANPTVIELDLFIFTGSAAQVLFAEYIQETFEKTFANEEHHINVKINYEPKEFPGIYYDYMMTGEFDLAIGGISGSSLDAAGFLDVYASDNRGGFTLNWGIDTSVADIIVEFDNGTEVVKEVWSFDAIVAALNGDAFLVDGREGTPPPAED